MLCLGVNHGEFPECMGNSLGMGQKEIAGFGISKELEGNSTWRQICWQILELDLSL